MTKVVRQRVCRPLVALALMVLSLPGWPPAGRVAADATVRLRIGVTRDGIVEITAADLRKAFVDANMDPPTVNPDALAMSSMGQPVAIRVITDNGGFKSLQFFGQRFRSTAAIHPEQEEKYTDERVYWLDIGGASGVNIPEINAAPRPDDNLTPPSDFLTTVRAEESNVWWTLTSGASVPALLTDNYDTWFWTSLQTTPTTSVTATLPYTLPYPAPGFPATLRLEEVARTWSDSLNPDHRTAIGINGVRFPAHDWEGKVRKVFTETVPADFLVNGLNNVTACSEKPKGAPSGSKYTYLVYVNYWEIDYRRLFRAWDGQVDFVAEEGGPHEYLVSGWGTTPMEAWDISNPNQPFRLYGFTTETTGGDASLRFYTNNATGAHFWMQATDKIAGPDSLRVRKPTILRDSTTGADAVIVTAAELAPAAERLAEWHRANGRRALVVDIQDVFDEFSDGICNPKAVPLMLAWAKNNWIAPPPAYLTLVGDGHWNFKNFNPAVYPGGPNLIPPFLAWVDPWQGETPADPLYGDWDFDGMPDVAVGRLAVNSLTEATTVVDKIVNYRQIARVQAWQQRALFVAERYVAGDANYPSLSDQIIAGYLPADVSPQRVYLGQTVPDAASARAAISDAVRSGVLMVQYSGHGDVDLWSKEAIWSTTDVSGLQNKPMYPVVMTFNCKDGYFAMPGRPGMAESMQRQPGGGAVAAISPSGLGATGEQHALRQLLMETIFQDDVRDLGRALLIAKQRYAGDGWPYYQVATVTFYGEPAMRLPGPAGALVVNDRVYLPFVSGTH